MEKAVTTFLNVDVELRSQFTLEDLRKHLRNVAGVLYEEEFFVSFEANGVASRTPPELDRTIRALVRIVEAMPSRERRIWDQCQSRCFDIGIEAGHEPRAAAFDVSTESLRLLQNIGAEIRITVYAAPILASAPAESREMPTGDN
jgi:hypothetical protein